MFVWGIFTYTTLLRSHLWNPYPQQAFSYSDVFFFNSLSIIMVAFMSVLGGAGGAVYQNIGNIVLLDLIRFSKPGCTTCPQAKQEVLIM